jgi:hypothetical protein
MTELDDTSDRLDDDSIRQTQRIVGTAILKQTLMMCIAQTIAVVQTPR